MLFNPPIAASWVLKKLCYVKSILSEWLGKPNYQIQDIYNHQLESSPQVRWEKIVWNQASIPRELFVFWLAMISSLQTRDKLVHMGVIGENVCLMYHAALEFIDHIFFKCAFSFQCL